MAIVNDLELDDDSGPLCLGCHVDAELDGDGYCSDCNDENDEL